MVQIKPFKGTELEIDDLAQLRIAIFREYPHLHDGDKAIGASTAIPLKDEMEEIKQPFLEQHFDIESYCYFGESILEK